MKKMIVLTVAMAMVVLLATSAFAINVNESFQILKITGTGAAINVSVGFNPRKVVCYNPNDAGTLYPIITWIKGMAEPSGFKDVILSSATGTVTRSLLTTTGINVYAGSVTSALTGTVTTTAGSAVIGGSSTVFTTQLVVGDTVNVNGQQYVIAAIISATSMVATTSAKATTAGFSGNAYRVNAREPGFVLGADTDMNVAGEVVYCEAWR